MIVLIFCPRSPFLFSNFCRWNASKFSSSDLLCRLMHCIRTSLWRSAVLFHPLNFIQSSQLGSRVFTTFHIPFGHYQQANRRKKAQKPVAWTDRKIVPFCSSLLFALALLMWFEQSVLLLTVMSGRWSPRLHYYAKASSRWHLVQGHRVFQIFEYTVPFHRAADRRFCTEI